MTTEEFLHCLAQTESHDNPDVHLGDAGRALGRWQTHPDWVWGWAIRYGIKPILNETWDSFIRRIIVPFFNNHIATMPEIEVAMYFHLGHHALPTDADWDAGYAERFQTFAANYAHP